MTLIITALAEDVLIQVSDRRLTYSNGAIASNLANKAICVTCLDAMFTIAYTGLAQIGHVTTDHWLVDHFTNTGAANKRFDEIVKELRSYAALTFSKFCHLGNARGITFIFAGFRPLGPFIVLLSNQEDEKGNRLKKINDSFDIGIFLRNDKPMHKVDIMINGAEDAITLPIKTAIRKKIRSQLFRLQPEQRVLLLVDLIRRASGTPKAENRIGSDVMSVIMSTQDGFHAQFHPENKSPLSYTPHFVAPEFSIKDVYISTDPAVRPSRAPKRT